MNSDEPYMHHGEDSSAAHSDDRTAAALQPERERLRTRLDALRRELETLESLLAACDRAVVIRRE